MTWMVNKNGVEDIVDFVRLFFKKKINLTSRGGTFLFRRQRRNFIQTHQALFSQVNLILHSERIN